MRTEMMVSETNKSWQFFPCHTPTIFNDII